MDVPEVDVCPRYFIHRSIVERDFDLRTINSLPIYPPIAAYFLVDGTSERMKGRGMRELTSIILC